MKRLLLWPLVLLAALVWILYALAVGGIDERT